MQGGERKNKLEQTSVGKLMIELCFQTTFSIMLYNFYIITDTFFVAKGIGSEASGAIGVFSPFLVLVGGISSTLGTGGGSIISRRLGENNTEDGKKVVGCIMWIWYVCALVITIAGLVGIDPLLKLLGCTTELYPYAKVYGKIMIIGVVTTTGFSGIMRAEGDSTYSTFQWCGPVIVNLLFDPLLIYTFKMGIAGAAVATLMAQLVSMGSSIYYFFIRKHTPCRVTLKDIKWDGEIAKEIFYIGIPAFLNSLGGSFTGIMGNQIIGKVGGTIAISTYAIVSRFIGFIGTPFSGLMQGIQPMLGFDWGRKNKKRIEKTIHYAVSFSLIYGGVVTVMSYLGAEWIIKIFSSDPKLLGSGTSALRIIGWSLAIGGIMPIAQGFYQALGKGKMVFVLSLMSILCIRLPLIGLSGFANNLQVVWFIFVLIDWIIASMAFYFLNKGRKQFYGEFNKE